eukprot:739675-Pelagomonas_calceolata.AAC.1
MQSTFAKLETSKRVGVSVVQHSFCAKWMKGVGWVVGSRDLATDSQEPSLKSFHPPSQEMGSNSGCAQHKRGEKERRVSNVLSTSSLQSMPLSAGCQVCQACHKIPYLHDQFERFPKNNY